MQLLSTGFWNFEDCSKRDVLTDRHIPLILQALVDQETEIEQTDKDTFIISGTEEALLVESTNPIIQLTLLFCTKLATL